MTPSSGAITIAASAPRVEVDNRISLRLYYRIANNLLKKADVYRVEGSIIDQYVMLLRFSSLISETIPRHKDYQFSLSTEKNYYKKRLLNAINELEDLKPDVRRKLEELHRKSRIQVNQGAWPQQVGGVDNSLEWPPVSNRTTNGNGFSQVQRMTRPNGSNRGLVPQGDRQLFKTKEDQSRKLYLRPTDETLSRHSILGPNGLHGQWQPPVVNHVVQYPSNLDFTPVEIPSLLRIEDANKNEPSKDEQSSEKEKSPLEEVLSLGDGLKLKDETRPMIDLEVAEALSNIDLAKELTPPPVLAEVQDIVVAPEAPNTLSEQTISLQDELVKTEAPMEVHISTTMMDTFMRLAKSNTNRNLETCGVLAGSLKNKKFYVTALIIPKQESTSDSCQTTNEEEIFEYQDKQSLFPLGWIHTHPTQSCFMSSIDLHTHFSYQIMLPEAIAIVMAPRGGARTHGIFRLTSPGGMTVIRQCPHRGFHPHKEPEDGGPIYDRCSDVFMNPNLKFDVVDLR